MPISINRKRTRVTLQRPDGPAAPNGDGSYTQPYVDLAPPQVQASIAAATTRNLEHAAAGSTLATATHVVTIWYRPDVTTETRVVVSPTRTLNVLSVLDPADDQRELELLCTEVVP
jgi:SPP1 family predicted phage head-tail adaptor